MPSYEIDDEYFSKQYMPIEASNLEEAEVRYRREFARILAHTNSTTWAPFADEAKRKFRSKIASILRRGLKVREFHGTKPECGTTPADVR